MFDSREGSLRQVWADRDCYLQWNTVSRFSLLLYCAKWAALHKTWSQPKKVSKKDQKTYQHTWGHFTLASFAGTRSAFSSSFLKIKIKTHACTKNIPFHQKHQFRMLICCPNDFLGFKSTLESRNCWNCWRNLNIKYYDTFRRSLITLAFGSSLICFSALSRFFSFLTRSYSLILSGHSRFEIGSHVSSSLK